MELKDFKETVLPLRGNLLCQAKRMLGDKEDAEDIVQEVYLKLWSIRDGLDCYDSLSALASRITHNLCVNRLRSASYRQEPLEIAPPMQDSVTPDVALEQKEGIQRIELLIDSLPDAQRHILRMKHLDGLEVEEIAELTGSSAEAVRMNLSRARRKVRDAFLKQEQYKNMHI
ncbi:MAG: sigma-70 family RNA polymerase sigma factor [Mediterranea sp.]|jgi:RNA polymerase sigma-70 factor (ECF subfamily)|nr:sigma-70 family RNA polymerase sigma factor [Mediterranea sp.]